MKKVILVAFAALIVTSGAAAAWEKGHVFANPFQHCLAAMRPVLQSNLATRAHCILNETSYTGTW